MPQMQNTMGNFICPLVYKYSKTQKGQCTKVQLLQTHIHIVLFRHFNTWNHIQKFGKTLSAHATQLKSVIDLTQKTKCTWCGQNVRALSSPKI
jgi:hypothetical protein